MCGLYHKSNNGKISQKGIAGRAEAERSKFKDKTKSTLSKNYIKHCVVDRRYTVPVI